MASKPSAERIYAVIVGILQRRHEIKIEYELVRRATPGPIFSDDLLRIGNKKGVNL